MSMSENGRDGKEKQPFIMSSPLFINRDDPDPLAKYRIDNCECLQELTERSPCPKCSKSRMYFCYTCCVPVTAIKDKIPCIKLPVKVDIIRHPREVEGKSTSTHAAVLSPCDVRVYVYPQLPDYQNEKVLLVFPGKNAVTLEEWFQQQCPAVLTVKEHGDSVKKQWVSAVNGDDSTAGSCRLQLNGIAETTNCSALQNGTAKPHCQDNCDHNQAVDCLHSSAFTSESPIPAVRRQHDCFSCRHPVTYNVSHRPIDRVIFIDSTWKQTKRIYGDARVRALPCVVLTKHKSLFWRYQRGKSLHYLATIEAIYYFLVELHQLTHPNGDYDGRFDNLLFFFRFMYYKIRTIHDPATLKAYM